MNRKASGVSGCSLTFELDLDPTLTIPLATPPQLGFGSAATAVIAANRKDRIAGRSDTESNVKSPAKSPSRTGSSNDSSRDNGAAKKTNASKIGSWLLYDET
jgi:hypothetical protein